MSVLFHVNLLVYLTILLLASKTICFCSIVQCFNLYTCSYCTERGQLTFKDPPPNLFPYRGGHAHLQVSLYSRPSHIRTSFIRSPGLSEPRKVTLLGRDRHTHELNLGKDRYGLIMRMRCAIAAVAWLY